MALLIVLACVALVSGLLLALLAQVSSARQLAHGGNEQIKVDLLLHGAMATITGDLRQEVMSSTQGFGAGLKNAEGLFRSASLPAPVGENRELGMPTNLLKRSAAGKPFYKTSVNGAWLPSRRAGGPSIESATSVASANRRWILPARWNRPLLLPKKYPLGDLDWTPEDQGEEAFVVPDWIYQARDGSNPERWSPTLGQTWSDQFVVGRYAYTIYHEGGLLDVNAAGFPGPGSSRLPGERLSLAWCDFHLLPGFRELPELRREEILHGLIGWRNFASVQPRGHFPKFEFELTNYFGLLRRSPNGSFASATSIAYRGESNRTILRRQDLLSLVLKTLALEGASKKAKQERAHLQEVMQYLSTYSRWQTAPAVVRDPERPRGRPVAKGGNNAFGLDSLINPDLPDLIVKKPFLRANGELAKKHEPLVNRRFALSRLRWLTADGPSANLPKRDVRFDEEGTAIRIKEYFGLIYSPANGGQWIYNHGQAGRILRLSEIEEREADFFELLQAGILVGSLGKSAGATTLGGAATDERDQITSYQLMQIGASIVDQADPDHRPTQLVFDGRTFYGVENLPYLNRLRVVMARVGGSGTTHGCYIQPEIWNPHQDAGVSEPREFRLVAISHGATVRCFYRDRKGASVGLPARTLGENSTGIEFDTDLNRFGAPQLLDRVNQSGSHAHAAAGNRDGAPTQSEELLGICAGLGTTGTLSNTGYQLRVPVGTGVSFQLQYRMRGSSKPWITYSIREHLDLSVPGEADDLSPNPEVANRGWRAAKLLSIDPRTDRFSFSGMSSEESALQKYPFNVTLRPGVQAGFGGWLGNPDPTRGWVLGRTDPLMAGAVGLGTLSENVIRAGASYYKDPDGVIRGADGMYHGGGGIGLMHGLRRNSRPVILNRPFRSVTELGYAFRGMPCKSLDFFSGDSGDAALLDFFSIKEEDAFLTAHFSLNTRQVPVLQSILAGSSYTENSTEVLSEADAWRLGSQLVGLTSSGTGGLRNRSELVTRWAPMLPGKDERSVVKREREAVVRSLADVGETRSWNLLIDVIAQSGRFSRSAKDLSGFTVEAEKRVWLHLAMDRITGEVLGRSVEVVYE